MFFRGALNSITLSHKLFFVITALNLLTISTFTYFAYTSEKETILRGIDNKLIASGQGIKVALDSFHEKIANPGSISAGEYRKELDALSAFADSAGIKYAYSVMMKDGGVVFTSSSYTKEELAQGELTSLFEPYEDAPAGLKTALEKNAITYDQYADQWGTFRSVFIPSPLPNGVTYVIGIDVGLTKSVQFSARPL